MTSSRNKIPCCVCHEYLVIVQNKSGICAKCKRKRSEHPKTKKKHLHLLTEKQKCIERKCLKCDDKFWAEGRFNRICPKCEETNKHCHPSHWYTSPVVKDI